MEIKCEKNITFYFKTADGERKYILTVSDGSPLKEAIEVCGYFASAFHKLLEESGHTQEKQDEEVVSVDCN